MQHLQTHVSNLLLDLRSLERIIYGEVFRDAFANAGPATKTTLEILVLGACDTDPELRNVCLESIKREMRRLNKADWTIRELKDLAQEKGISGWSRMSKDELLSALYQREQNVGANLSKSNGNQNDTSRSGDEAVQNRVQERED